MHELSIAKNILEIVQQNVPAENYSDIESVRIKLGDVSGVAADSLQFSFEAITSEPPFGKINLDIKKIPFLIQCSDCMEITTNEYGLRICGSCSSADTELVSGDELIVEAIVVRES